jgi:uncharacterized paraquat-inducible protein A
MSYRCGMCQTAVPQRQQMLRVTKYRMVKPFPDSERLFQQVEKETPVCEACHTTHTKDALAEKFNVR